MVTLKTLFLTWPLFLCILSEELTLNELSKEEIECLAEEKVYYKDACYKLARRRPCEHGQWLVLDKNKAGLSMKEQLTPTCKQIPCDGDLIFWSKTNTCVTANYGKKLCEALAGTDLLTDNFGEGECACIKQPIYTRYGTDDYGPCYRLYHRGPCPLAMVFAYPTNKSDGAQCVPDVCYEESLKRKRERTMDENGVLAPWEDGKCYELETKGPCREGTFSVSSKEVLSCVLLPNQILDFDRPQNCYSDQNGQCQKVVKIKSKEENAEKYMQELYSSFNSLRKRRWTDIKRRQRSQPKRFRS